MKNIIVTALFTTVLASPAFALHELNCSNASGSIVRTEQEIWGANPVDYTIRGQDNESIKISEDDAKVKFIKSSKVVLASEGTEDSLVETYAIRMELSRKDGQPLYVTDDGDRGISKVMTVSDFVICHSYANSGQD